MEVQAFRPLGGGSVIKQNLARVTKNAKCLVQGRKECIQLEAGRGRMNRI